MCQANKNYNMVVSLNKKKAFKDKKRQVGKRRYKTLIKNHLKEMESKCFKQNNIDPANSKKLLSQMQKILDQAAQKGIIHKNNAARKKSKISQKINGLTKQIQPSLVEEE